MASKLTAEEWRPVPRFEGLYEVSNHGRVRSLARYRKGVHGAPTRVRERILTWKPGHYPAVSLSRDGRSWTVRVHLIVLHAFNGPRPEGMEACHGDGDKWNCRLENLRWDTASGNHADRVRHGVSNRGERSGSAVLTRGQVMDIRSRYAAGGVLQRDLASEFGVSQSQISQIVSMKRWAA